MSQAQPQPGEPIKRHYLLIDKAPTVWWSRGAHKGQGHEFTACKELAFGRLTRLCTQAALLKASGRQRRWDRGSRNEQEPEAGSEGQESLESPLPPGQCCPTSGSLSFLVFQVGITRLTPASQGQCQGNSK